MKYFFRKGIFLFLTVLFAMNIAATAANRFWVFKNFYDNDFSTPAKIADWMLVEDDGTGGFASSGHGTAILTMDDGAGSFANRLFNINGGSPRFVPIRWNGRGERCHPFSSTTVGRSQVATPHPNPATETMV